MSAQPLWTSAEAQVATGGHVTTPWQCGGISSDSRKISRGDLFIALSGPNFDGHDFVEEALAKGAAAALVERRPEAVSGNAPLLVVDDVEAALGRLAAAARQRNRGKIIAITGSVGKTSTKQALAHVLAAQAPTFASRDSFNNHWGVPLSLAALPADAQYGIFEIGMNRAGEISALSKLVRPHAALVTTVEEVHLEFFESVSAIADAKAEIFDGIEDGGVAILNYDNPYRSQLANAARLRGLCRKHDIICFGVHPHATLRLVEEVLGDNGVHGVIDRDGERISYRVGAPGRHWLLIGLAVLAAVSAVGADLHRAALALSGVEPLPGRGQRHRIPIGDGAATLIDESYNANPASMRAAIALLAGAAPRPGGRRIAVLGDMLELGGESPDMHAALAGCLVRSEVDLVFTVGDQMRHLRDALPQAMRAGHGARSADLAVPVAATIRDGDVIMVKGSLGSRMATIIEALHHIKCRPAPRAASNC